VLTSQSKRKTKIKSNILERVILHYLSYQPSGSLAHQLDFAKIIFNGGSPISIPTFESVYDPALTFEVLTKRDTRWLSTQRVSLSL
jgi:hypothetical protein